MELPASILRTLTQLAEEDRLRRIPQPMPGLVDFCSNDYLGLARAAAPASLALAGAGGARLLAGTHAAHIALEAHCAHHFQGEAALLYNSGYQANLGILSCLAQRGDTYLYDDACHASLKDGIRLSMADRFSFRHNDLDDLRRLLLRTKGNRYIVVESLYSMDGDWCDLAGIVALAQELGAWVIVDEAHSTGIVGPAGAGLSVRDSVRVGILVRMHAFGKAIGRMGAVVVGPQPVVDYLVNRSRAWIYSTAMPAGLAQSILEAIVASAGMDAARDKLRALRRCLVAGLTERGIVAVAGDSPIYPLIVPGAAAAKAVAARGRAAGFDVRAVLAPTVPAGEERLRIVLHSFNTEEEVLGLVEVIADSMIRN